jgi:hypothetical protein
MSGPLSQEQITANKKRLYYEKMKGVEAERAEHQRVHTEKHTQMRLKEAAIRKAEEARAQEMQRDMSRGQDFARGLLGSGGLGRLAGKVEGISQGFSERSAKLKALSDQGVQLTDVQDIQEDPELAAIQGRLRNLSEQGLSRPELQMKRERAFGEISRATQTASRRAQALLARAGVRGSVAGRQLLGLEQAGMDKRADVERDLFLESENIRRQALGDLSQFSLRRQEVSQAGQLGVGRLRLDKESTEERLNAARRSAYGDALSRQSEFETGIATFDLGQAAREKDMLLQAGLGFAQMGVAERSARRG